MTRRGVGIRISDLPKPMQAAAKAAKATADEAGRQQFVDYCTANRLPAPAPEYQFHPVRKWRIDFAFVDQLVALEIEGASWGTGKPCPTCGQRKAGAHTRGAHFRSDLDKYGEAAALGWRLVRVTPEDLYEPKTLDLLRRALGVGRVAQE